MKSLLPKPLPINTRLKNKQVCYIGLDGIEENKHIKFIDRYSNDIDGSVWNLYDLRYYCESFMLRYIVE